MRRIRINNEISSVSSSTIRVFAFVCVVLFILNSYYLYILFTKNISIQDELVWICAGLFIVLILFLIALITSIKKRKRDNLFFYELYDRSQKKPKVAKYIEFCNEGITICYINGEFSKISFERVDKIKLNIRTFYSGLRYYITGLDLELQYYNGNKLELIKLSQPSYLTIVDKIFEIVYFSRYVSNFSYRFSQDKEKFQKTLGSAIESFISNNYRHTPKSIGETSKILVIIITVPIVIFILLVAYCLIFLQP